MSMSILHQPAYTQNRRNQAPNRELARELVATDDDKGIREIQLKEHTAGTAPHNLFELRPNVLSGIAKIRRSQSRLQSCLSASDLLWK